MKVNVITPTSGGPFTWGKDLTYTLNKYKIKANHNCGIKSFLNLFTQEFDIIHTASPITYFLWNKPTVLTVKGVWTKEKKSRMFFWKRAIKKANIITVPSKFLKEELKLKNAIVIPNAICSEDYIPVFHKDKNIITISTITNFAFKEKARGIIDIIKILNNLETSKMINYQIIGSGKYLDEIKKKAISARENLRITFLGYQKNPRKILEKSDVFLYCSYLDNFPNVILEAMASGLPVLTNNIGAVKEIIENKKDGFIADIDEYPNHLLDLMDNYKLRKMIGGMARRNVKKKFDWDKIVKDYIKLYGEL